MVVNGGGIWVVRETSCTCLASRVFEWFYISAKSFLTLSLGVCIKKKIQPIRILKLQTKVSA